jgi:hypothetical protein
MERINSGFAKMKMVLLVQFPIRRLMVVLLVTLVIGFPSFLIQRASVTCHADELEASPSWQPPTKEEIEIAFAKWLDEKGSSREVGENVIGFLRSNVAAEDVEIFDLVFAAMIIAEPGLNEIRESLRNQRSSNRAPDFSHWIENPEKSAFVRNHVRLYVARWLAQNQFYDEALAHFRELDDSNVIDPVTLLFYRGLMEHQLLQRDDCVKTMERLLEQEENLPRRFGVLSKMMIADIRPLEPDSLDEISRLMSDIRRRTELHRSGQNVRKQEQDVIEKLDKLIESLESQQAQQQPGGNAPSSPMEDSFNAGGRADGDVARKKQIDGGNWGNLPPAQRAAALAEIAKDLPPHYRSVIEEYFRQLANESNRVK